MLLELERSSSGRGHFMGDSETENMKFLSPGSGSGVVTEDITDIDVEPKMETPAHRNTLMSLLSGKQDNKKKLGRGRKLKAGTKTLRSEKTHFMEESEKVESSELEQSSELMELTEMEMGKYDSNALTEELSEVTDTSFDAMEFERKLQRQKTLAELELRIFKEGRSISAKDFLKREKKLIEVPLEVVEELPVIELVNEDPIKLLEERVASKRMAAKDLFSSFAPKRLKNSKGEWTLKVKLRIDPAKLAAVKEFENPLMAKGNTGTGKSFMSTIMRNRQSHKVTLKLPTDFLKDIARSSNPLYTKSSGNQNGKPAKSVFAMMMQSASQSSFPKLTPIQELKELLPPTISRSSLHVCAPEQFYYSTEKLKELPLKKYLHKRDFSCHEESLDSLLQSNDNLESIEVRTILSDRKPDPEQIAYRAPLALTNPAHKRIYEEFVLQKTTQSKNLNWPQKFQPPNLETLLLASEHRHLIQNWIENAFLILSNQSTKTPRNVKLREQAKRQRKRDAGLGFIVDDNFDEGEETEEDVFVPVLIISGESGSCKSSSVYAALNALNGYVHEINAGQQRSRKDLYGSIKEFCTTQIIHQNLTAEAKTFQKGVVLFEDCDILFEQDKTFWTVVQDVVNFSKRPIVITVTEPRVIPRNIWDLASEQSSIIHLLNSDKQSLLQYIWLCAYSHGCDLCPALQDKILDECKVHDNYDLRKALMTCQWLCYREHVPQGKVMELLYEAPQKTQFTNTEDLEALANKFDLMSASDVICENSNSKFLHDSHVNELLDIYVVHDSMIAKQPTLKHELNIGHQLKKELQGEKDQECLPTLSYNQYRQIIIDFISSRKKKLPRFVQELQILRSQTRSRSSSELLEEPVETQPLPDTSTCYSMSPKPFILDLAPITRIWSRLQKSITAIDIKNQQEGLDLNLESFLRWRRFYHNVDEVLKTLP